jgi:hypothetical protein
VAGQDQAAAQMRARLLFVRMPAMRHHIDRVEPTREEALIGVELELVRHDAGRICEHAVLGDNGITFDARRPGHVSHFWHSAGRQKLDLRKLDFGKLDLRKPDLCKPDLGVLETKTGACVLRCLGYDEA